MSFIQANVTTDPSTLLDQEVDAMNTTLTGNGYAPWSAQDAQLAVIILATIGQLFADVVQTSASVLPAIFRAVGTQLFGIPYQNGVNAKAVTLWTFTSASPAGGYDIDQGTAVIIDGQPFYVQDDYTSNEGDTSATLTLIAAQFGVAYNDLGGVDQVVQPNDQIDYVAQIMTLSPTSGGQDPQTDEDYQNAFAAELTLLAPRPLVDADFAIFVQTDTSENATGVAVGRATTLDGYYPDGRVLSTGGTASPSTLTCTITNGSPTVYYAGSGTQVPEVGATVTGTGIPTSTTVAASPAPTDSSFTLTANATASGSETLTVSALSGYGPEHLTCTANITNSSAAVTLATTPFKGMIPDVGARVTGAGIPNGATVLASPAPTTSGFSLSANATATTSGETLTISSWTSVSLAECTFITDDNGDALTPADMDAELAWLETYRPQNYLLSVTGPSYTTIYVTCLVKVLPNYDPSSIEANAQTALLNWLSSAYWGNPSNQSNVWLNSGDGFNIVRYKEAIAVATVPGVAYVDTLTLGTSPSPGGTSDITMAGPAPLPLSTDSTILVTTE
jgi:hypothetical protein